MKQRWTHHQRAESRELGLDCLGNGRGACPEGGGGTGGPLQVRAAQRPQVEATARPSRVRPPRFSVGWRLVIQACL